MDIIVVIVTIIPNNSVKYVIYVYNLLKLFQSVDYLG